MFYKLGLSLAGAALALSGAIALAGEGGKAADGKEAFGIGEPAPEFRAGRWLNGPVVERFEPGRIYVMEFWATWCGPCRAAMPHLSELARKHADRVTIIGVDILEKGDDPLKIDAKVDRFMADGGNAMKYPVCRDTSDLYLTNEWYKRSGSPGIPATIVVDGKGNIAWLGNPAAGLDKALDDLVAGTFDYKASAVDAGQKFSKAEELNAVLVPVFDALQAKEWARVVKLADEAAARDEKYRTLLRLPRYQALLHVDEEEARKSAHTAMAGQRMAREMATIIAKEDGLSKETYALAFRAVDGQTDGASMLALASLNFRLGQPSKAVELQQQLIEIVRSMNALPVDMEPLEEDLKKYQEAVRAAAPPR